MLVRREASSSPLLTQRPFRVGRQNSIGVSGPDCGRSSPGSGETHGSVFRTLRMEEGLIVCNNGEEKETLKKNRSVRGHVLYSANVTFCADQLLPSAAFTGHISNSLVRRQFHQLCPSFPPSSFPPSLARSLLFLQKESKRGRVKICYFLQNCLLL